MKFLDIASGPGYVAAAAAKRGATVLGVDFSGVDGRAGADSSIPESIFAKATPSSCRWATVCSMRRR